MENKWHEILTGLTVNIASFAAGTSIGWSSPINPKLLHVEWNDTPLPKTASEDELSWISSLLALGAFITPFIGGPLSDVIGRKWTLLSSSVFFVVSYILLLTTNNVPQIYIARLIQGFGVGFVMTVQPMYIGEIASDNIRGAMGSLMQLFISSGILYVYAIGPYVSYYNLQWACLAIPIIFGLAFFFMKESPNYLITKNKIDDASISLQFLRHKDSAAVQDEIIVLQKTIQESMQKRGSYIDIFKSKASTKALIISVGLLFFQQLAGINAVLFNATNIFFQANGDKEGGIDENVSAILIGAVMVFASGVTPFIVDRLGRRIILLFSAAGMAVSLTFLGLYFFLDHNQQPIVESITWLPVTALIVYIFVYSVGFGPLPWAVMGEMFSPEIKSKASAIVASFTWFLGFCVTRWFSAVDQELGTHWTFWIFAIGCVAGFIFTFFVLIETKGLSLQEIQKKLTD